MTARQGSCRKGPKQFWWKEASVYQIYPASFCDSNGDGVGDLPGIISKLDYLSNLGVDVVWLCPVYKSPQVDMGYDIADYRSIHPPYGTMQHVDALIRGLHDRQMKLVMDLVVNHTSDQHAWFQESRSSPQSDKRNWYIWRKPVIDGNGNRHPPNNWASVFGGSAWAFDEPSGEYYLHLFCPEQPDLNWENPSVVQEVHRVMEFWLDKGVDGFRMDVINFISKTSGLPDAAVTRPGQAFQPAEKLYANGPHLHEYLRGLRRVLDRYDAFAVGEMPCVDDEKEVLKAVAGPRNELNMIFQFELVDIDTGPAGKFSHQDWTLQTFKGIVEKWQACMYENDGWNALFLENHDQSRSVSRFTPHTPPHRKAAAKMLASVIGLQAGTLFVYQGQELGMANLPASWPIEEYKDVETQNFYRLAVEQSTTDEQLEAFLREVRLKARDHGRSPVQWSAEKHGGFTTGTPWMRVSDDYTDCNAAQQETDPSSVLAYWRRVIRARRQHTNVVVYGDFCLLDREHPAVFSYQRRGAGGTMTVVANFGESQQTWELPEGCPRSWTGDQVLLANYPVSASGGSPAAGRLSLRPFEVLVILQEDGGGTDGACAAL
ncbi:uncharacterized protein UV8b_04728 [Ustilaginoidea virens]|uniref:Glycosyl hydrolase family 13 catalytic domain-containing protein n=1 Tax=Ustilaginoidea virens TaxID=1159556 RepID=A0A8E5HS44_USTVR|nr:uncharacterized protein UV8b_04728 [Ustilaginoidea virens]QUC20487.1 hypothetical protein UV8b_04728 [Ustilaginoidea virens]